MTTVSKAATSVFCVFLALLSTALCKAQNSRLGTISGVVVTKKKEAVGNATVILRSATGEQRRVTDVDGNFRMAMDCAACDPLTLRVEGQHLLPREKVIHSGDPTEDLEIEVGFIVPPVHESMVIAATPLDPSIDRRNGAVYRNTLFGRDDQLLFTLDAGVSAGQHEGGGKSLEIRRFGYNVDHGGVNGGLKILVDDVQQNQSTQAHGQGYLGQLKSLSPELIADVEITNGPFNAEYGDFSGLGVVHIRLKQSLANQLTLRVQGGSFGAYRTLLAYSPGLRKVDSFIAYEGSETQGPFQNPLRYRRDNFTANYTWHLGEHEAVGFKFNAGRNDFFASGQVPLDEVAAGRLDRFGFIDPFDGGRVRNSTWGAYYRREGAKGDIVKLDTFVSRSLFDLFSNFTFFLNDPIHGDGIQQHDSRLQEGINAQYLRPYTLFGQRMLFTAGSNFHDNQINVGLFPRVRREAFGVTTSAHAHVANAAGYFQQGADFWAGRLHIDAGLRLDYFRFTVQDRVDRLLSGTQPAARFQPKANLSFTPWAKAPLNLYFNYGRGISSQDARGVVERPQSPKVATTDFYQLGTSHHLRRISLITDVFFIDRSHEQVYVPDDGSLEYKGRSRAYGFEVKTSARLTRRLALNGGLTRVSNVFYPGTSPRIYVDSAPHAVANLALTMAAWHGFSGSLRYRHVGSYRLDGLDSSIRAAGLGVMDLSLSQQLRRGVEFNLAVDNLTNKRYFETQNFFASRLRPEDPIVARIHGTPGYSIGVTVGLTFRLFEKNRITLGE